MRPPSSLAPELMLNPQLSWWMECGILWMECGILWMKCGILWMECGILWMECGILWMECGILWMECGILWMECGILWMKCGILWMEKNKVWLWKAFYPVSKRVVQWELGGRNDRTLKRLLGKMDVRERVFVTDDFKGYPPRDSAFYILQERI